MLHHETTQFQERVLFQKPVIKKGEKKKGNSQFWLSFFALNYAAYLLNKLPNKKGKRQVFGPACLLDNWPWDKGQIFKWDDPESMANWVTI